MNRTKLVVFAIVATGCGELVVITPPDDGGASTSSSSSSTSSSTSSTTSSGSSGTSGTTDVDASTGIDTCTPKGGVCLKGNSAPPNRRVADPKEATCALGSETCWLPIEPPASGVCKKDQDCNDDPSVSSFQGSCFDGLCVCKSAFHVQPSGKCGAKKPPDCPGSGGTCRQMPAQCKTGELEASMSTSMACGDFVAAVCCIEGGSCKAPVDLVCCGAAITPYEPLCVNGWKTCEGGHVPSLRKKGCPP